jgi:formylglycine-generating enzyme required for sulfatase activity
MKNFLQIFLLCVILSAFQSFSAAAESDTVTIQLLKNEKIEFVRIPAGSFVMGASYDGKWVPTYVEQPVHDVTIEYDFYIGKHEITQGQWLAVMRKWPGRKPEEKYGIGPNYPAYNISWHDSKDFIKRLDRIAKGKLGKFRLPSESEWEFACRGPESNPHRYARFSFGDSDCYPQPPIDGNLSQYAWWMKNAKGHPHPVGKLKPNPFGLYDMHGNVWEWCEDDWHKTYKGEDRPDDGRPWGDGSGAKKASRSSYYSNPPLACRSAARNEAMATTRKPYMGFRLIMEIEKK